MNSEGGSGRGGAERYKKQNGRRDREDLLPNFVRPSEN
jgi:hypothetical protein